MKKIPIILLLMLGTFSLSFAQITSTQSKTTISKQDKAAMAAQKKADKAAKALAKKQAREANVSATNTTAAAQKKADKASKALAKKQAKEAKVLATNENTATQKADKEAKTLAKRQAKEARMTTSSNATSAHLNKNGTLDKRFKVNKETKSTTQVQNRAHPTSPVIANTNTPVAKETRNTAHVARTNGARTPDKVISTNAEGRTIYLGPRGGKYYINKNGNKEYVK